MKCLHCKTFFINPVLLPCSHSMCLSCALAAQTPFQAPLQSHVGGAGGGSSAGSCASSGHNTSADSSSCNNSDTASVCGGSSEHGDGEFSDKLSVVSETDSGVICCGGTGAGGTSSRPNSFIGTAAFRGLSLAGAGAAAGGLGHGGILSPAPHVLCSLSLVCPACRKLVYFDENGARNLPRNKALANVVLRYTASLGAGLPSAAGSPASGTPTLGAARSGLVIDAAVSPSSSSDAANIPCQLCEGPPSQAAVLCEQCEIYYCQTCQQSCHPPRGPLAQHNLVPVLQDCWSSLSSPTVSTSSAQGVVSLRRTPSSLTRSGLFASSNAFSPSQHRGSAGTLFDPASPTATKCPEHLTETLSLYCTVCKWPVCCLCIQDNPRHANHDVQSLSSISKAHKVRKQALLTSLRVPNFCEKVCSVNVDTSTPNFR